MPMGCSMARIIGHNGEPLPACRWRVRAYCRDCGKVIKGKFPSKQQADGFANALRSLNASAFDVNDPFFCLWTFEVYEAQP